MTNENAVEISGVTFRYGDRVALRDLDLQVRRGEIYALLGPNGGGKTTLFRLLSTLIPLQQGSIKLMGLDVQSQREAARAAIGVVFQAPSLDKKLTVGENLRHQGHLYGLSGPILRERQTEMLARLGLQDRVRDRVETLSGGLRRRVELAKGMIHRPSLLLMDEPSTGLDPAARSDLWEYLESVRTRDGVTILLTTHLLEEAERADRIGIINAGELVAEGAPEELRATVGGDSIVLETDDPHGMTREIHERFQREALVMDGAVRLEIPDGHTWIARLVEAFPGRIRSITLGKPTLEDVFIDRTGHRFWREEPAEPAVRSH